MKQIYYLRIKRDLTFTIDDVPMLWRTQVQQLLDADQ